MMHEFARPSHSREIMEKLMKTKSEEEFLTIPKIIRAEARTKCIRSTVLSLPNILISGLDTKRAEKLPMLMELSNQESLPKYETRVEGRVAEHVSRFQEGGQA